MCDSRCSGALKRWYSCARGQLQQLVAGEHQFADQGHQVFQHIDADPDGLAPDRRLGRRRLGRLARRLGPGRGFAAAGRRRQLSAVAMGGGAPAAARFRQGVQRGQQRGVVAAGFGPAGGQSGDDHFDPVDGGQHRADAVRRDRQFAVAHLAQHVLGRVRHLLQPRQAEEAAGALDRVHQAED